MAEVERVGGGGSLRCWTLDGGHCSGERVRAGRKELEVGGAHRQRRS
jgi:hypothetical protein